MPCTCTHVRNVTKKRVILLYCLVMGKVMDVGLIIQQSILRAVRGVPLGASHTHLSYVLFVLKLGLNGRMTR